MKSLFEVDTICRLCLRADEKVKRLNNTYQKVFIERIIKLKQDNYVPTDDLYICCICSALLTKSFNFMQTIWRAQKVMCSILRNNNTINKQLLYCIDRQSTGLNPITLTSVVTYRDEMSDGSNKASSDSTDSNASTDIEELDLDFLIKKEELRKQKNPKTNKVNYQSTNKKKQIICISDDDEESDKCNLDEMEGEICNNFEIDGIKAESSDLLTKELNTDVCDEPIPKTQKAVIKKKFDFTQIKSKDSTCNETKRKYYVKKVIDDDYEPDSTSHSEDSDYDSYDDEGKPIKRPKDDRVYPRQCDHCNYEVPEKRLHSRHYLFMHPNIRNPYQIKKDFPCSICGKLYPKVRLDAHEAEHTQQDIKCKFCPKVCSSKKVLHRHVSRVHPRQTYTCDYCSKIFKTRTDLLRHIRIHTGSKPFKCHICGDKFAHSGNRSIHIRVKHQNLKYVAKKQSERKKCAKKRNSIQHTVTEISTNSEKAVQKTKSVRKIKTVRKTKTVQKTKTVRKTKTIRKSNNQYENNEVTLQIKGKVQRSKNNEAGGNNSNNEK